MVKLNPKEANPADSYRVNPSSTVFNKQAVISGHLCCIGPKPSKKVKLLQPGVKQYYFFIYL
jgi:hypothetical protein